jgi:peptidoglycan/xylan/chitin deacetylase (PgdA/CDA1 family)
MTGDRSYIDSMIEHRDWLFGRNPWGTSMFTMIPRKGEYPNDVHLPLVQILKREVPGGLVDGPIDSKTYSGLIGLKLDQPDEFAEFQTDRVVYHDDVGDYSTNEPTMDGTADAILMMAALSVTSSNSSAVGSRFNEKASFTYDQGAIVRGAKDKKQIALVFTGDEFGDGLSTIARTLERGKTKASFFFTGRFYRNPAFAEGIRRLKLDGNYLGPHSNAHLLYADWNDRAKTLVTNDQFVNDLNENFAAMKQFGISRKNAKFFLPPFEWHNNEIAGWTRSVGLTLTNFTQGTRSNADYTTPDMKAYRTSDQIFDSIKDYEAKDPSGLNGFVLLLHIGTDPARTDKFYDRLDELIKWLHGNGYSLVRIDRLLDKR